MSFGITSVEPYELVLSGVGNLDVLSTEQLNKVAQFFKLNLTENEEEANLIHMLEAKVKTLQPEDYVENIQQLSKKHPHLLDFIDSAIKGEYILFQNYNEHKDKLLKLFRSCSETQEESKRLLNLWS